MLGQTLGMGDLQAILFDMDGTLVETESLWHESEIMTMSHYGASWSEEEQKFALGGPFDMVAEYMAKRTGVPVDEIGERLILSIDGLMRSRPLPLQPGIRELHDEARAAGIPTGLVTNSFRQLVEIVLESSGLEFDITVAGDELSENKPHPMPYLVACSKLGVEPAHTVVLEDSTTGIESALSAGCYVIAIPHLATIDPSERQLIVPSAADLNLDKLESLITGRGWYR